MTTLAATVQGLGISADIKSYLPMLICLAGGVAMAVIYVRFLRTHKTNDDTEEEI